MEPLKAHHFSLYFQARISRGGKSDPDPFRHLESLISPPVSEKGMAPTRMISWRMDHEMGVSENVGLIFPMK